jgi:WD repeat-containing protein 26
LSSVARLRSETTALVNMFHANAAELYPRKIRQHTPLPPKPHISMTIKPLEEGLGQSEASHGLDSLPGQLSKIADEMEGLLRCLNGFPEFKDEVVNELILSFTVDLRVSIDFFGPGTDDLRNT